MAIEQTIVPVDNGVNMTHSDFCYKPITGQGCIVTSPMQYWKSDYNSLMNDKDVKETSQCIPPPGGTERVCFDKIGVPVMQFTIFGKLSCEGVMSACTACKVKAGGLQTTFLLNNNAYQYSSANEWEKQAFIANIKSFNYVFGYDSPLMEGQHYN